MAGEIVRTPVPPAERPRRSIEERVLARFPALVPLGLRAVLRLSPHSTVRRRAVVWGLQSGWEANNRNDWVVNFLPFHPDYLFTFEGDDPRSMVPDIGPRHVGHAGVKAMLEDWRGGFEAFRFEPREALDPGGNVVAARVEQVGRAGGGIEIRQDIWSVWWFESGLVARQQVLFNEDLALAELERG